MATNLENSPSEPEIPSVSPSAASTPVFGVGGSLKSARERMGRDLPSVADQLRIRQQFLSALEEGRHKDLPGGTYAIGFLRSYAEFLGLDSEEMVRRFKQEAAGDLHARAELVFPSPVSEGRIPNGAKLFVGLLIAAIAYGGWYWMSGRQAHMSDAVPTVPDRLASMFGRSATVLPDKAAPAAADSAAPAGAAGKETESASSAPASAAAAPTGTETAPSSEAETGSAPAKATADGAPMPEAGQTAAAAAPAPAPAPAPEAAQSADATATAADTAPAETPAKTPDAAKPANAARPGADTAKPAVPTKAADIAKPADAAKAPDAAKPAETTVYGSENADSRVVLRASADDCWIQLREMNGQLLLSRLLRKGESYRVPNRPGLTLTVGNSGALDIVVDGQRVPSLGQFGQVRRDVSLDPAKLLAGQ